MKRMRHVVRHDWIREGHDWPPGIPRKVGDEDRGKKLVHIAERRQGTDLDIWWTEEEIYEEGDE
jgi:hypothetical protein